MLRLIFFGLLATSLALNGWLLLQSTPSFSPGSTSAAPSSPAQIALRNTSASTPGSPLAGSTPESSLGARLRAVRTEDDVRAVAAELARCGFSPPAIRELLRGALAESAYDRIKVPIPKFYQAQAQKDFFFVRRDIYREIEATLDRALGPSPANFDRVTREQRFGNLSDEKIAAIERIQRDYAEIQRQAAGKSGAPTPRFQQTQLLEQEKQRDLAAVLTPDELEQYEMRNSQSSDDVRNGVRNIEVNDEEFTALYRAQRNVYANWSLEQPTRTEAEIAGLETTFLARNEQARAVLGEERFFSYLASMDDTFSSVSKYANSQPDLTRTQQYDLYRLQLSVQTATIQWSQRNPGAGRGPDEKLAAELVRLNGQLERLLGPTGAATYRGTNSGRLFNGPTKR